MLSRLGWKNRNCCMSQSKDMISRRMNRSQKFLKQRLRVPCAEKRILGSCDFTIWWYRNKVIRVRESFERDCNNYFPLACRDLRSFSLLVYRNSEATKQLRSWRKSPFNPSFIHRIDSNHSSFSNPEFHSYGRSRCIHLQLEMFCSYKWRDFAPYPLPALSG